MARPWTEPPALRASLARRWQRGELLREWLAPGSLFPLRLALRGPTARELSEDFAAARDWVRRWQREAERAPLTLEWRSRSHRQLGENQLPTAVVIGQVDGALSLLGEQKAARQAAACFHTIVDRQPALRAWCLEKPLRLLTHAGDWERLLAIVAWLQAHPRPAIYLRQLAIPGVHSKFIEAHRAVLGEMLDRVLPAAAIDAQVRGAAAFERRYGFRLRPSTIRFRFLDASQSLAGLRDLQVPLEDFAALELPVDRVIVIENAITALAFPPWPRALAVFGQGYEVIRLLESVPWLEDRMLYYWGDLDTHGFAILDGLRAVLPRVASVLMDRPTLERYRAFCVQEPRPVARPLGRLTAVEALAYDTLVSGALGDSLRLEQERIPLTAVQLPGLLPELGDDSENRGQSRP
jgi:hypothetical protein